jgi:hypothetical protein
MQKDMLDILVEEGFQINERELLRVRLKFGLLLRQRRRKAELQGQGVGEEDEEEEEEEDSVQQTDGGSGDDDADSVDGSSEGRQLLRQFQKRAPKAKATTARARASTSRVSTATRTISNTVPLDPDEALRRQLRQEQLRIESAEKWQTRKRRRRTRGWAGLPPDAPGEPPRFPSETTLDESKAYLGLDNTLYRELREQFQAICQEEGVAKKTIAGPERWGQLKQRLARENAHLRNVFQRDAEAGEQLSTSALTTPTNAKALSLDVICTDVTKRIRTIGATMRIPDAKNVLGLNPDSARRARSLFTEMLEAKHFTTKIEAGEEGWQDLKREWIRRSDALSRIFAARDTTPDLDAKNKAVEFLARDVLKRLRNEHYKKDASRQKAANLGPGPGPAPPSVVPHASNVYRKNARGAANNENNGDSASSSAVITTASPDFSSGPPPSTSDFQIDPSLLLAASDPSMLPESVQTSLHMHGSFGQYQPSYHNHHFSSAPPVSQQPTSVPLLLPLPIYFRLHPHSRTPLPFKTLWLNILQDGTLAELRTMAMREHPGTVVLGVEGVVVHKAAGARETEICIKIDVQEELVAYLRHIGLSGAGGGGDGSGSGKATFVVLLGSA